VDGVDPNHPRRQVQAHLLDVLHDDALAPPVTGATGTHVRIIGGAADHARGRTHDDDRRTVGQVRDGDRDGVHHAKEVDVGGVGCSQSPWRMAFRLAAGLQSSHRNGGRLFLMFVADPKRGVGWWNTTSKSIL
jgi:hypothetical protein